MRPTPAQAAAAIEEEMTDAGKADPKQVRPFEETPSAFDVMAAEIRRPS